MELDHDHHDENCPCSNNRLYDGDKIWGSLDKLKKVEKQFEVGRMARIRASGMLVTIVTTPFLDKDDEVSFHAMEVESYRQHTVKLDDLEAVSHLAALGEQAE